MKALIPAKDFLNKLSKNSMSFRQLNRAIAYLRANKVVFYDTWGEGMHVVKLEDLEKNKPIVINALRVGLYY